MIRDAVALIGMLSLGYGLYLIVPAYAFIVDGAILILMSVFGVSRSDS